MAITDDLRKTLTDPTPLYALAGTADLASEKLREVPALVEKIRAEAPKRFESVRDTADTKAVQELVSKQAKEAQDKLNELLGTLDSDIKKIREQAQDLALQGVGRAAEYAVKAREAYDELAERGRGAVQTWRGEAAAEVEELAVVIEPDAKPAEGAKTAEAEKTAEEPKAEAGKAEADDSAAAKKAAARKPAAKKTTPPSAK